MNESDFRYVDDPTVAINDEGVTAVAWADQAAQDILLQLYGPDGVPKLPEPTNISTTPDTFSWLPRLVLEDGDDPAVHVLWQEIVFSGGTHGGEIFYARSDDVGESFEAPLNLSQTEAGAGKGRLDRRSWHNGSLDLVAGPEGTLYAAWTEYEGRLHVSRSTDGGQTFSASLELAGGDAEPPARAPSLATADDGTLYIAWTIGEDRAANIHVSYSADGGETFEPPREAAPGPGHADAPKLAIDSSDTVHLVFGESPAGPATPGRIQYARTQVGAAAFNDPRTLSPDPKRAGGYAHFPHLSTAAGGLYVLWEHFPDSQRRPLGLGMTFSAHGGDEFAKPSLVPGSAPPEAHFNGSQQGMLMRKLAANPNGDIAVVNSTFRPNEVSRIRLIRGRVSQQ